MFEEDLSAFFDDFAVEFSWQGQTAKGILDQATSVVQGQVLSVNSKQLTLHKPHNVLPGIAVRDTLTINGRHYVVRRIEQADDGAVDAVMIEES